MRILVTGGAGYIGSETCKELFRQGHEVTVFDNLSSGHREFVKWGVFVHGDILDLAALRRALHNKDGVIHFAAKSLVGESVVNPELYVNNNIGGTLHLLAAMRDEGVPYIVVSGSCSVYGQPATSPVAEECPYAPLSPYAETKTFMEWLLKDFERAHNLKSIVLRYFNAAGADFDGDCWEWHDPETHLIPRAIQAALGQAPELQLFGNDYPTQDGTCIRDYIHILDLARAHVAAIEFLAKGGASHQFNLGTGKGYSVLEVIQNIVQITGVDVPYRIVPRRPGDPAQLFADIQSVQHVLKWQAKYSSLEQIIESVWKLPFFQKAVKLS